MWVHSRNNALTTAVFDLSFTTDQGTTRGGSLQEESTWASHGCSLLTGQTCSEFSNTIELVSGWVYVLSVNLRTAFQAYLEPYHISDVVLYHVNKGKSSRIAISDHTWRLLLQLRPILKLFKRHAVFRFLKQGLAIYPRLASNSQSIKCMHHQCLARGVVLMHLVLFLRVILSLDLLILIPHWSFKNRLFTENKMEGPPLGDN
jgi:hypothetical protein